MCKIYTANVNLKLKSWIHCLSVLGNQWWTLGGFSILSMWFITKRTIKQCFENLVFYKMCSQNAANAISGIQMFKFFRAFGTNHPLPKFRKVSATVANRLVVAN
jgi:hypothetical protein